MEEDDIDARLAAAENAAPKATRARKVEEVRVHPVLTNAEVEEAIAEAKKRLDAAERKAARDKLIAESMDQIRRERNALTGQVDLDEEVTVTIDVAEYTDRIILDGEQFFHGQTYKLPRHKAATVNEMMFRSYMHQAQLDGKDPQEAYRRSHAQHITKAGTAPVGPQLAAKIGAFA
jgi:hypothetical protein